MQISNTFFGIIKQMVKRFRNFFIQLFVYRHLFYCCISFISVFFSNEV